MAALARGADEPVLFARAYGFSGDELAMLVLVIVVAEGPSAAGKSTWSRHVAPERRVEEAGRLGDLLPPHLRPLGSVAPPTSASADEAAAYWVEVNAVRWAAALDLESGGHTVVCDTDPIKLHDDDCLAVIGVQDWSRFEIGIERNLTAIEQRRLGLADLFCVHIPTEHVLAHQAESDAARRRSRFDVHRRLGSGLRTWYSVLDDLDPGRVVWGFPDVIPPVSPREVRADTDLFARWMARLPRGA